MKQNVLIDKEVKKKYLNFIKSQEVLSEPFRDKEGQLNDFYLPIAELIKKKFKKKNIYNWSIRWSRLRKVNYF